MAQWNKVEQDYLNQERSLFEVNMIATKDGSPVSFENPFPVSLGSSNITINGDVSIGATVDVSSTPENPVHTHITEVGISSILTVPYLPVGISTLLNTVSIGTTGQVSINLNNSPVSTTNPFPVTATFGNQTDSNRLKTSPFQTVFFNTFQYGKETDVWDERIVGVGTATWNQYSSNVVMQVGSTSGSKIIRQTRNVMRYIPGRGSTLAFAIRLDNPQVGIRRRFGLFDDSNGAYFEDDGGTYSYVIRTTTSGITTEVRVGRNDWNGDKFDGYGPSGVIANPIKQQMISIAYEWYGAGTVNFNWLMNGETVRSHSFINSNTNNFVWCSTPFLPIRLEIENVTGVAGTHYLYQGSNSLIQEGEPEKLGALVSQSNGITGTTMTLSDTFYPIISVRLKSTSLQAVLLLRSLQAVTNDNTNVYWKLLENATLTGANWTNHANVDSFAQYDVSATSFINGRDLLSGFTVSGGATLVDIDRLADLQLGRSGIGTISDTYTLVCASPNTNKKALAVLNWIEQR
jgi:hypothetical protein